MSLQPGHGGGLSRGRPVLGQPLAGLGRASHALARFSHPSALVRIAPWVLLVGVLFLLVFVPFGLLPAVSRLSETSLRLRMAEESALQAQRLAATLGRDAGKAPGLREQVSQAEKATVSLEGVPGTATTLAADAQESGVTLLGVGYGAFTELAPPASSGQKSSGSQASKAPYGQVPVDVTAAGSWTGLARFLALAESSTPGLRVTSWSVSSGGSAQGTYQLRLSGVLYVRGRPPVQQAVTPAPTTSGATTAPPAPATPGQGG